jgi:hypothetical protein
VPAEVAVGELERRLEAGEVDPVGLAEHGQDPEAGPLVDHLAQPGRRGGPQHHAEGAEDDRPERQVDLALQDRHGHQPGGGVGAPTGPDAVAHLLAPVPPAGDKEPDRSGEHPAVLAEGPEPPDGQGAPSRAR